MKLLIIIPAYNEASNIVKVVEELKSVVPQYDYVVVNDGSFDATAKICCEHGYKLLDLPVNLGLTGAFQAGMRYAVEHGYDAAVQIDGDGQHDPKFLPAMAEKIEADDVDMIIGSRFVSEKRPLTLRFFGNALLNNAIRVTTGKKVTDSTSGMRMYGKRLLWPMAYDLNSTPEPDTVAYFLLSGARLEECQVTMRERTAGESYLNAWRSFLYMVHMSLSICLIQRLRKRRIL